MSDSGTNRASDKNKSVCRVVLVNLPFASAAYPSLALGTLKPVLAERGHWCVVRNFNVLFARVIGSEAYEQLIDWGDDKLGEQIFAQLLYPERSNDPSFVSFIEKAMPYARFEEVAETARRFIDDCSEIVSAYQPDVVGFTTTFYQTMPALALAKALKALPSPPLIVFGGAACELPMGPALLTTYSQVDVVFHGDADNTFPDFIDALSGEPADLSGLRGLCFRSQAGDIVIPSASPPPVDMDRLPVPDFSDYTEDLSLTEGKSSDNWKLTFETSRGCWWGEKNHCTFCGLNGSQMIFHHKTVDRIIEQLQMLAPADGERLVLFSDNILHYRFLDSLVPRLGSVAGLKYFFEIKANLREEHVRLMASNGIIQIQPGIERLDDRVLQLMRKGTSAAQNVQLLRWCAENGISTYWNILYGFPGEEPSDVEREISLIRQITHLPPPQAITPIRIDRFSPYHDRPGELGLQLTGPLSGERYAFYGADQIDDMAYHFDFQYLDETGERMAIAWQRLCEVVEDWRASYQSSQLIHTDVGADVIVADFRRSDSAQEITLEGTTAEIYRFCTRSRPRHAVLDRFPDSDQIIDDLIQLGLFISHQNWLLAGALKEPLSLAKNAARSAAAV